MKASGSLDSWREYFRRGDSDIFGIIDHAIMVAATDCPNKFKSRRDKIAELLFSCRVSRCIGCDHLELSVPGDDEGNRGRGATGDGGGGTAVDEDYEVGGSKESKANSSRGDNNHIDETNLNSNQIVSNYTFDEAEALSDEIEEFSVVSKEVARIKEILLNKEDEPNSVLLDSLRHLKLMSLNVDILKKNVCDLAIAEHNFRHNIDKQASVLRRELEKFDEAVSEGMLCFDPTHAMFESIHLLMLNV